jgi:NADH-quinone oxidoreductase subunit N
MDATALLDSTGALLPHMTVLVTGLVLLALDLFLTPRSRYLTEVIGIVGIVMAFLWVLHQSATPRPAFLGMAVADALSAFFNATFLLIALLTILLSTRYVRQEDVSAGEYYALVLFATTGFMFAAAATDLVMLFLAIEVLSIATYILAGLQRQEPRSQEAAFKYFILGAFSSAFFLYGIATIYGAQGHTNLVTLGKSLATTGASPLTLAGMGFLMVGLGFKVAAVPFHMWAPDVYEGAPTPVTAFMTAGPKAAAFAALLRVFFQGFAAPEVAVQWTPILAVLAGLTMLVGNVVAITQQSIKRMLAYSSIAHAGYAMVALAAHNALGASSILYYLVAYALMSLGSFTILTLVPKPGEHQHAFADYAGLGTTNPGLSAVMAFFMFALAGFPPTAGFAGKFYVFSAAMQTGHYWLALIGVLTSVVSVVYYARVVVMMYMHEPTGERQPIRLAPATVALLGITALGILYMGVFPGSVLRLAEQSVQWLF